MSIDSLASAMVAPPPKGLDSADKLKSAAERGDDVALEKAAREFEAYFVREMLGSMRSTAKILGEGILDSSSTDTWTEQLDSEVADSISSGRGIGLATMIAQRMRAEALESGGITSLAPAQVDGVRRDGWSWPLADQGSISSDFGSRRHPVSGEHRHHAGLDLAAPQGTPIFAAASGRVTHAGPMGTYGQLVEINHGDGIVTRYAHQSAISVAVGQEIFAGDPIGEVGSTGRSTGPHLHLEVRREGEAVDPLDFLGQVND